MTMVWAGCMTCRKDPEGRKWIGFWVREEVFPHLTPAVVHGFREGMEDHVLHAFTPFDFGVPEEQSESDLQWQANYAEILEQNGEVGAIATLAKWLNKAIWDVEYTLFKSLWYGEYSGPITKALRKRYTLSPAGPGTVNLWRRA